MAARHLKMLGFDPVLYIVKKSDKEFFIKLTKTAEVNDIKVLDYKEITSELE